MIYCKFENKKTVQIFQLFHHSTLKLNPESVNIAKSFVIILRMKMEKICDLADFEPLKFICQSAHVCQYFWL